jgi:hypothetical protein
MFLALTDSNMVSMWSIFLNFEINITVLFAKSYKPIDIYTDCLKLRGLVIKLFKNVVGQCRKDAIQPYGEYRSKTHLAYLKVR